MTMTSKLVLLALCVLGVSHAFVIPSPPAFTSKLSGVFDSNLDTWKQSKRNANNYVERRNGPDRREGTYDRYYPSYREQDYDARGMAQYPRTTGNSRSQRTTNSRSQYPSNSRSQYPRTTTGNSRLERYDPRRHNKEGKTMFDSNVNYVGGRRNNREDNRRNQEPYHNGYYQKYRAPIRVEPAGPLLERYNKNFHRKNGEERQELYGNRYNAGYDGRYNYDQNGGQMQDDANSYHMNMDRDREWFNSNDASVTGARRNSRRNTGGWNAGDLLNKGSEWWEGSKSKTSSKGGIGSYDQNIRSRGYGQEYNARSGRNWEEPFRSGDYNMVGRENNRGPMSINGGTLQQWSFDPSVESVLVEMWTEGLPIQATVELLQQSNRNPESFRVYEEDGYTRPYSTVIDLHAQGGTVLIRNDGPVEYPIVANVQPYGRQDFDGYNRDNVSGW